MVATTFPDEGRFQVDRLLTVAAGHLVHDTFAAFLNPLFPLIIDKLNLSLTLVGTLTLFNRLPSLLNPFIGVWADRIDLCLLVILAPAATAIVMSLLGLAPSYGVLALLLLVAGLSSAAMHVPGPVIVVRVSGKRVGTGMSVWMMAGEMARTIGPLFAVAVVSWWTLEGYYPVMLLGIFSSLVLFLRLRGVDVRPMSGRESMPLGQAWRVLRRLIIPLTVLMILRSFMRLALMTFLPILMTDSEQSLWAGGGALAVVEFAGALGALAAGTISDRIDRRLVLFVALILAPPSMLLFLSVAGTGGALTYGTLALTGLLTFSTTPVIMAAVQDYGQEHPATANGIYMGINFIVGAAAAPVVGWVGDMAGLHTAFLGSAIVGLLAAPLAFFLPRSKPSVPVTANK